MPLVWQGPKMGMYLFAIQISSVVHIRVLIKNEQLKNHNFISQQAIRK